MVKKRLLHILFVFIIVSSCIFKNKAVAQYICRDTTCAEFQNALDGWQPIPENFTGYMKIRKKAEEKKKQYSTFYNGKRDVTALDIIKVSSDNSSDNKYIRFKNEYKIGQITRIIAYRNGKQSGIYDFHDNGNTSTFRVSSFSASNSTFKIITKFYFSQMTFYKDGTLQSLLYPIGNNKNETSESYYPNQNLSIKYTRINNAISGIISNYYSNGKIQKIGVANENLINGYVLSYKEDGSLDSVHFYKKNTMQPQTDSNTYKSQFVILRIIADESNKQIDRKNALTKSVEDLKKTEEEKKLKEQELKHQEEEVKRKQLELELLAKDKAVSDLTIKAKEAELIKNLLLANEKKKEIDNLNQQKIIQELTIKNNEAELVKKNIEAANKQKQILGLQHEKELSNENLKQQQFIRNLVLAGAGLLVIFLGFVFVSLSKSRKANKIIALQQLETTQQKHLVEEKQKEIIESISYAKRLQEAILPPQEFVNIHLANNFIYYQPKDIVAGDFYWAEKVGDKFFIAAADSTGHGVPGAMVSVVCSSALNRTIKEFKLTETGKILDKTRELVVETFEKSTSEIKDGMDISLLCIDSQNKNIYWSGANNPLWYIQDNELKEIKADKQPIGKTEYAKPFTTHQIEYKADTTFYLFTDGFADQFGGPNGKKFKYKQFSDLLIKNNHLSQKQQSDIINKAFSDWKGDLEQVDDVCVIGIKI